MFLKFNSKVDEILLVILLSSHNEAHSDENITGLISAIVKKVELLLELWERVGEVGGLGKNIRNVIMGIGQLQSAYPLVMKEEL